MVRAAPSSDIGRAGPAALADDRIRLAPLGADDADLYLRIYTDPALMAGLGGALSPAAARRSFAIARGSGGAGTGRGRRQWWAIRFRTRADDGLGLVGLEHDGRDGELGVIVVGRQQGAGVAGRALGLLGRHAFDALGLAQLHIRHGAGNPAMAAVAARLGCLRVPGRAPAEDWLWRWRPPLPR